jgi:tetratricopeptide (TPR) repeat protein
LPWHRPDGAPALVPVHSTLGKLYLELGRDREARTELRRVIDANKATADDRLAFAEATINLGVVDQAERALADAADAGAMAPRLGRLKLLLQSWKGPKEALVAAKALEKERRGPAAHDAQLALATANAWRRAGDLRKAGDALREALYGDPLHANLGLGKIQLMQNDMGQAETSFRAALAAWERGPFGVDDQTEARVGLGRALLARKALDEAVATLGPCATADPAAPEPHYWLARVHAERGENDKARTEADKATQLDDRYTEAFLLLGDLTKGAERDRAKKAYRRYLELSPDGEKAKTVKRWLASIK